VLAVLDVGEQDLLRHRRPLAPCDQQLDVLRALRLALEVAGDRRGVQLTGAGSGHGLGRIRTAITPPIAFPA
jgi:hypothetical protein